MTREEYIRSNSLESFFESRGSVVTGNGAEKSAKCLIHQEKTASVSINSDKQTWFCHGCSTGGSIFDLMAKLEGASVVDILKRETDGAPRKVIVQKQEPATKTPSVPAKIDKTYQYHNEMGEDVFQVVRMIPKTFRQRHIVNGNWVWNMEGVQRYLYRLPEVIASAEVWIVEGEKDADNLRALGFCATCNVGGAGKWMDGYTDSLRGKSVVLCGDNDDAGRKHMDLVFQSVSGKCSEVRLVKVPAPHKDASDFIAENKEAKALLQKMRDSSTPFYKGVKIPLKQFWELEDAYSDRCKNMSQEGYNIASWIPMFKNDVRTLIPGELAVVLGGTGVGKTAILSNIANSAKNMVTLFFELELPADLMFERLAAMRAKIKCSDIEREYSTGGKIGRDACEKYFPNLFVCTEPKLKTGEIERIITMSELKTGKKPQLVLLDYIGLIGAEGGSKYERMSNVAEELKVIAKSTGTIIIVASQISRKGDDSEPDVYLSDGKDSGSIENSAGLVIGAWRNPENKSLMHLKILKNTKGQSGKEVVCVYDAEKMRIEQKVE
jgi:5S rRNA maturation endonuclease (ribonuclease M5)